MARKLINLNEFRVAMKIVRKLNKEFLNSIRVSLPSKSVREKVYRILSDVEQRGDDAVLSYTEKFDKVKLTARQMRVSEAEVAIAFQQVGKDFISALKVVIDNVYDFYKKQQRKSWKMKLPSGAVVGERILPLERVGVYVPGGQSPLVSSVYMAVVPAKVSGVKEIFIATPPDKNGKVNPFILVVSSLLKVNAVFKIGGAQAIAAFAYGTKTIPKVDKIVGPGNQYVTEAKRQVFGLVDIDLLAGPSEVVVIANQYTPIDYVIADLKAQAEHVGGTAILLTTSKRMAREVRRKIPDVNGYIVVVKSLEDAIEIANKIAPEHLEILVKTPMRLLKKVTNAGAVFLGLYSPTALGDYYAGPSHILPTGGTARMFSGLSLDDFVKKIHIIGYSKRALEEAKPIIRKIAEVENMNDHLNSVQIRQ